MRKEQVTESNVEFSDAPSPATAEETDSEGFSHSNGDGGSGSAARRDVLAKLGIGAVAAAGSATLLRQAVGQEAGTRKVQYAMVIDTRRCIGCHACTVSCKSENNVPLGSQRCWVENTPKKDNFPMSTILSCPVFATIAANLSVWTLARQVPHTNAKKTGLSWLTRIFALAVSTAYKPVPTMRASSTPTPGLQTSAIFVCTGSARG